MSLPAGMSNGELNLVDHLYPLIAMLIPGDKSSLYIIINGVIFDLTLD